MQAIARERKKRQVRSMCLSNKKSHATLGTTASRTITELQNFSIKHKEAENREMTRVIRVKIFISKTVSEC